MKLPPGFDDEQSRRRADRGHRAWPSRPTAASSSASRPAALRVIKDGQLLPEPFVTLAVDTIWERGLIGVALDPSSPRTGFVYVTYVGGRALPAPPRQPVHGRGRRRRAGQRGRASATATTSASSAAPFPRATRAGRCTSARTASSTSPSASRRPASPPSGSTPSRASCCGSTPTAPSPRTILSSRRRRGSTAPSGRSACATRSRSPCSPGPAASSSTTWAQDKWEEVNEGFAGANYGWPESEGATSDPRFRGPIHIYPVASVAGGAFCPKGPRRVAFPPSIRVNTSSWISSRAGSRSSTPTTPSGRDPSPRA